LVNRDAEDHGCRIAKKSRNPSGRRSDNGLYDADTFAEEAQLFLDLADVSFADDIPK
jgi:hypothetical protein